MAQPEVTAHVVCWYHPMQDTPELRETLESLGLEPQPNRHVQVGKMYVVDVEHMHSRPYTMEEMLADSVADD